MNIRYTPQVHDTPINYKFSGNIIQATYGDEVYTYNLSDLQDGVEYIKQFPIQNIVLTNGEIYVELINFIPEENEGGTPYVDDTSYEWHTPENEEFEVDDKTILLLEQAEKVEDRVSPEEVLEYRVEVLSQAVEELIILISMQSGEVDFEDLPIDIITELDDSALM